MNFTTIEEIESAGFVGFKRVQELFEDRSMIPPERGVYLVLRLEKTEPKFMPVGVGGIYKGKDPNVKVAVLKENWVPGTIVINIGQAGGIRKDKWSDATLRDRLRQYMRFGQGKKIGHKGGRYIWQLENYRDLIVCWKSLPGKMLDPKEEESKLISAFKTNFGKRPFANLQD